MYSTIGKADDSCIPCLKNQLPTLGYYCLLLHFTRIGNLQHTGRVWTIYGWVRNSGLWWQNSSSQSIDLRQPLCKKHKVRIICKIIQYCSRLLYLNFTFGHTVGYFFCANMSMDIKSCSWKNITHSAHHYSALFKSYVTTIFLSYIFSLWTAHCMLIYLRKLSYKYIPLSQKTQSTLMLKN